MKVIGMIIASALVSAFSFSYENTHECISSDGSSILFKNKPSKVPLRMYVSEECLAGEISDHAVILYVKLHNPDDDGLLFKGTVSFMYRDSSSRYVNRLINRILNYGLLIGRSGGHDLYRIERNDRSYIAYIPVEPEDLSFFECFESFCDFNAIVPEIPIFYSFLGRYSEGFDPLVAEQVMKDFVRQVFNL
jgi:hypothetical protein